jgi:hypothetical protein
MFHFRRAAFLQQLKGKVGLTLVKVSGDQFTVLSGQGIKERERRSGEWVTKTFQTANQTRSQWSTEEEVHMRPGHHCLCEFGNEDKDTIFENQFNLSHHTWEDYRGTRLYKQDRDIVIK